MKFYVSRILIHCSVFTLLCLLVLCATESFLDSSAKRLCLSAISIAAICNGIGEYVVIRFARNREKSSLFKIFVVRTVKFLCYLLLTLPLVWDRFSLGENYKLCYGLMIVGLFFVYILVEITYFACVEKQSRE